VIGTDLLGCQESDTVCLTPTFFSLNINNAEICAGEQATISVTDNNGQTLTYEWSPTETIVSGQGTSTIVVNPGTTTTYSVIVTNTVVNCETTLTSTVTVFVFDPPGIVITADPDTIIIGESIQLVVNQNPGYDYVWSSSTGEVVSPVYNPTVMPTVTTTYSVTVTDDNGCTGTASITIAVIDPPCDEEHIFLPNAFTPNNDGFNDMLYVRSNFVTSMELNIYNRWGEKVFTTMDINIGWDGTYRGKLLQPDVFGYYLIVGCPGNKTFEKKGNITLLH
jgi:gliding motility-associated-like protein